MSKVHNYYTKLPKHLLINYANPGFNEHHISTPFRMAICGSSGTMKTNTLLNLLHLFKNTFTKLIICCKSKEEPLYLYVQEKLKNGVSFYEGVENIPSIQDVCPEKATEQTLIVFDDLVNEKDQKKISEYYIRGRKKGFSCIYISQSYFKIPKIIRIQCNYIIIKKLSSVKDLGLIMNEYNLGLTKQNLTVIYKYCTDKMENFLLIDIETPEENRKYRKNFDEFIKID